jgi:hypothetical protein
VGLGEREEERIEISKEGGKDTRAGPSDHHSSIGSHLKLRIS